MDPRKIIKRSDDPIAVLEIIASELEKTSKDWLESDDEELLDIAHHYQAAVKLIKKANICLKAVK